MIALTDPPDIVADEDKVEEAGGVSQVPGQWQEGGPHPLTQPVTSSFLSTNQ